MPSSSRARFYSAGVVGCALVLAAVFAVPLRAHHGWGGYANEEFELTGSLETPVSLAGPHASTSIRVKDQVWNVVLAPPAGTRRSGLREGMIPVGSTVTVHGHRHRNPKTFEIKTERVTWNGRTFNVYPDRS